MRQFIAATIGLAALAACGTGDQNNVASVGNDIVVDDRTAATTPEAASASAELRNAAGEVVGTATASQEGDAIRLSVSVTGMEAGTYAVHIHEFGRCDAPGFESAGAHWNPTGRQHGRDNPQGQHLGDLPNIDVGADGRGQISQDIPGARVAGGDPQLLDADGTALLIHAEADDYRTDPSGESGARIACGVFG